MSVALLNAVISSLGLPAHHRSSIFECLILLLSSRVQHHGTRLYVSIQIEFCIYLKDHALNALQILNWNSPILFIQCSAVFQSTQNVSLLGLFKNLFYLAVQNISKLLGALLVRNILDCETVQLKVILDAFLLI